MTPRQPTHPYNPRLAVQARLLATIAKDAPRSTLPERQARAALVAVVVAIRNDSLDKLLDAITGYLQDELSWTDALADGPTFDLLSEALIDLGAVDEDVAALADVEGSDGTRL